MNNFFQEIEKTNIEFFSIILFVSIFFATAISYQSVYLFHLFAFVYAIRFFWLFIFKKNRTIFNCSQQMRFVFLFLLVSISYFSISLIWTPNLIDGFRWIFYYLCTSFVIFFVIQAASDKKSFKALFNILILLIIINAAVGLIEVVSSFRYPISRLSPYAGWFSYQSLVVPEVLEKTNLLYLFSMPTAFNWNPNNFALIMTVAFPILLYYKNKHIAFIFSSLIILLVLATASRICIISLGFIVLISLFFKGRKYLKITLTVLMLFIFTDGFYFFSPNNLKIKEVAFISTPYMINGKEVKVIPFDDESSASRKELAAYGLKLFKSKALFGHGANATHSKMKEDKLSYSSLHFFFLEILINGGLLLFLCYLILFLWTMQKLLLIYIRTEQKETKYKSLSFFLSLMVLIPASVAVSSMVYILPIYLILAMVFAFINIYLPLNEKNTAIK